MFNTKEQAIIKFGLENGKSKEEVRQAIINLRSGITLAGRDQSLQEDQGFLKETGADIAQIGTDIGKTIKSRSDKIVESLEARRKGEQGFLRTTAQVAGQELGAFADIIGNVFKGVVKAVLPQKAETAIKGGIESVITPVVESDIVKNIISKYNTLDEKTRRDIDASLGVASLGLELGGAGLAGKAIKKGVGTAVRTGTKALKTTEELAKGAIKPIEGIATGVKDIAETTLEGVKRIPGRITTNVAENKAVLQAIKELPTKTSRIAVQNGVDINDVKFLQQIPKDQKGVLSKLFKTVKDFDKGVTKTNPIEVVGEPIVKRLKELESARLSIGKKLGEVANNLGSFKSNELFAGVFESLNKVPGLNGLKVNNKGILDFTDTVLTTAGTASDRRIIQKMFTDAVKAGTGKQKHLLRQELFEILGGKKKGLVALTDTQDQAFNAIRRGLSNLLEGKNSLYKTLSNDFRKVIQPLNDMRRIMRAIPGADEDILNMTAGNLARRLTSNAPSNPKIRQILRNMDQATRVAGKSKLSVEGLQDFLNVLDRYYNITGKTTFQGQIALGVEKATGVKGAISEAIGGLTGKTKTVIKKAVEDVINEVLR